MVKEFKEFLFKGNLIEIAVGLIMATATAALIKAVVADLITPILAAIVGEPSFEGLSFTINNSHFLYGDLINSAITFISVGAAVFFFVVKPVNMVVARRKVGVEEAAETKQCSECLSEIPREARKCAYCASPQT
jgi:large conductance mechanosensitive channel